MDLTDLQVELRGIEERLEVLRHEIDKMKPKSEDEKRTDFGTIDKLAAKNVIANIIIIRMPEERRKIFFKSLSYILLSEEPDIYVKLLYLTRLSLGAGMNMKSEEIYKSGLEIDDIDDMVKGMEECRYTFLVEAFILSGINGTTNEKTLAIIADVAKLMRCDQEELRVIAQVAKCRLIDDMDKLLEMPVPTKNRWMNQFWDYIPYEWIEKNRFQCGELCIKKYPCTLGNNDYAIPGFKSAFQQPYDPEKTSSPCVIMSRCQTGSIVKAGEVICKYTEKEKTGRKIEIFGHNSLLINLSEVDGTNEISVEKELRAPHDGVVIFINDDRKGEAKDKQDEYLMAYVVSYFDDYNDFSQWFKNKRKGV